MAKKTSRAMAPDRLRRRAEERLQVQTLLGKAPRSTPDDGRTLHELQVHMIELEMQNEAYREALARAEASRHFTALYEFAPVAYLSVTHDSTIKSLNLAASRLLGPSRPQLKGKRLADYLDAGSGTSLREFLSGVFTGQGIATGIVKLLPAGAAEPVELQLDAVADENGVVCHLAATDISALKRVENQLRESRDDLRRAQALAHIGSWRLGAGGFTASEELARIFGQAGPTLGYEQFIGGVHPDDRDELQQRRARALHGEPYDIEYRIVVGDALKWLRERATGEAGADGRIGCLGTTEDISERKAMEAEVYRLAFHDPLTLLPNRRLLGDRLSHAMAASKRSGRYAALMFIDLDNFKQLNDEHGHDAGDLLLVEVARRLNGCIREMDTVARFGGDEYVVMLDQLSDDAQESAQEAELVAEKIRAALSEPYRLTIAPPEATPTCVEHRCTASIGLTLFRAHEATKDEVLRRADRAMYRAKAAGGDRFCHGGGTLPAGSGA